jgi:photosystem II stability/assembly factor-like uncharacterized protein
MYDQNLGFASSSNAALYRTTNGGVNWSLVMGETGYRDIHFVNSQTGWKANGPVKKTTNGGLNWVQQTLPSGGILLTSSATKLSAFNSDTLWAIGAEAFYGAGQFRGVIYRTTNGGDNWLFQIPDTSIHITTRYYHIQFINAKIGWAYSQTNFIGGVHTTSGGDTTWLTPVIQISNEIPADYKLYQNYPNPFNPKSNIKYQISKNNVNVKIIIFDIQGKELTVIVNQKQSAGIYETEFDGSGYSSGVYFYSLIIEGRITDTKKMILLK